MTRHPANFEITPSLVLKAYSCGVFPMAESPSDPHLYWIEPQERGVLPLERVHVPARLRRTIRQAALEVRIDRDFAGVIEGCAGPRKGEADGHHTWINGKIRDLYAELFRLGHCHTVEVYRDGVLVGGLYGVALGGAFFGESMFSRVRDASKVALVHLAARLAFGGYRLLDTQFITQHLRQFGTVEIPRDEFQVLLEQALAVAGDFQRLSQRASGEDVLGVLGY